MAKRIIFVFLFVLIVCGSLRAQNTQSIHVMVALCDNKYQGIVKVPAKIGNGQDTDNNLYWGCGYGIRTYFRKSAEWKELKRYKADNTRLERIVFRHKTKDVYLVADAYDGRYIKDCTEDFLQSCAGSLKDTIIVNNKVIGLNGNAKLLTYIGHNGLMDFSLTDSYVNTDGKSRDAIILACASKQYFRPILKSTKANPLVWTTNLMCPEAYSLHDAISTYLKGDTSEAVRNSAAAAYSKYQKCGLKAAKNLLVTGY
ncbi:hypothetical protein M2132_000759 [Dysgonomonas sp. PH5-45]|uniref:hypothetical protein n=1 Tax=unclassified Dysgonomonas TaxID=2630389 RepID=UPI0024766B12|nr:MULTISPECIES: hypothetical protein [unclassified Dysgonomonas]MDH6354431.1 hypothetical protein [Dysgonomonas sp. PH5-45]MDH6387330.1 hypothetical protein [Dysgonomonas sp. PH5-37]